MGHLPKDPIYDAIDLVIKDLIPFVSDNFDLDKNIYNLGALIFSYLQYKCENFADYFKDETLIINSKPNPLKLRPSELPKHSFEYIEEKYLNPNNLVMIATDLNYSCLLNDSLVFLRDLNGEVTPEFIRNYLLSTYKIKDYDLKELPAEKRTSFIRSLRSKFISFQDEIPYGPIMIKNTNKQYNIDFYSKAIDQLSNMLGLPEDLTLEIKKEVFSLNQNRRLKEMLAVKMNSSGNPARPSNITEEDIYRNIANSIGRFFFYQLGDAPDSRYIKIRKELEPIYLSYLNKNSKAA